MEGSCPHTVLVVEDEEDLREMMEIAVSGQGYAVMTAASGREALQVLERRTPSVVLLDLMLPEVDGWEVRAAMLRQPRWASIPVVVTTAMAHLGPDRRSALQPAAILQKPVRFAELYELLRRSCGGRP
jgi:CheY-like chemotaxis protein